MKILVMQLLRLGDVIAVAPVIQGLRKKYPGAEIDLMVNKEAAKILPLIDGIGESFIVDRQALQAGLGEADRSFFESYDRLRQLMFDVNRRGYDMIFNFTQNRFSARLLHLFEAKKKVGLQLSGEKVRFGSPWIEYLNQPESALLGRFHYTDVFKFAAGIDGPARDFGLAETAAGKAEAAAWEGRRFIAIQPYTSDTKKDWPESKIIRLTQLLEIFYPRHEILLLAAPFEAEKVNHLAASIPGARAAVVSLEGAYSLLKRAEALVTGDTSIKHLAVAAGTPVVEISLGGSDACTTGPYTDRAVVLRSTEKCFPCGHSSPCTRDRHACSQSISPELVAMVLQAAALRDCQALRKIAEEYKDQADVSIGKFSHGGDWFLENVLPRRQDEQLSELIARIGWKRLVLRESERFAEIGSECFAVQDSIRSAERIREKLRRNRFIHQTLRKVKTDVGRLAVPAEREEAWRSFRLRLQDFTAQMTDEEELYRSPLQRLLNAGPAVSFAWVKECRQRIDRMICRGEIERKALRYFEENLEG